MEKISKGNDVRKEKRGSLTIGRSVILQWQQYSNRRYNLRYMLVWEIGCHENSDQENSRPRAVPPSQVRRVQCERKSREKKNDRD